MLALVLSLVATTEAADLGSCDAPALNLPADIEEAKKSVLAITTPQGIGAGVIISRDGTALTAAHVVGNSRMVDVRMSSGLEIEAEVLHVDEDRDIAVIRVQGKNHPCRPLAAQRLSSGSDLFAIGSPADPKLAFSVSKGVVSGYPEIEGRTFLQTDTSLNPGNSGGPMLGPDGSIGAVVSWKIAAQGFEGLGFGIPADLIREATDKGDGGGSPVSAGRKDLAKVNFSTEQEGITIGYISSQRSASAATQYGNVNFTSTEIEDVCIAPCSAELRPDVYTFVAYGDKVVATRLKTQLQAGDDLSFQTRNQTRGAALGAAYLKYAGWVGALTGATIWAVGAGAEEYSMARLGPAITIPSVLVLGAGYGLSIGTKGKLERK